MSSLIQFGPPSLPNPSARLPVPSAGPLVDTFDRVHTDLRISLTDHCNIRCFYCMPEKAAEFAPSSQLLTFEEILRFVTASVRLGIDKIRLTGGEPLLRPRLADLISSISQIPEIRDLALTTNAVLLADHAKRLYGAGLRRLNIHLDTLDRDRFRIISRRDDLPRVMRGIEAAIGAGYDVIKINAVAVKGLTEPDIIPLVRFGRESGIEVRFIEFMPLDAQGIWSLDRVLTAGDIIAHLEEEFGPLIAMPDRDPRAPATAYQFADGYKVGFIASVSRPFCMNCNRVRLTSDGKMRNCLFANQETDVRHLLKAHSETGVEETLMHAIRATIWSKWMGHQIQTPSFIAPDRPMYSIGG